MESNDDNIWKRRSVYVLFHNGDSLTTEINGTKQSIEDYYKKNQFNMTTSSDEEMGIEKLLTKGKEVIFL